MHLANNHFLFPYTQAEAWAKTNPKKMAMKHMPQIRVTPSGAFMRQYTK